MGLKKNLTIKRNETYTYFVRWETTPIVYKPISNITQGAPCVVSCIGHGLPDGWRVALVSVKGMRQINAANTPPKTKDYKTATVLTADTLQLNEVNSTDYSLYTSGGYVQYNTPKDLTGFTAVLKVYDRAGGNVIQTMTTALGQVIVDTSGKSIKLALSALVTSALTWSNGVYELELTSSIGEVTALMSGSISVTNQ